VSSVSLLPATVATLTALKSDRAAFAVLVGADVPDGWPLYPEAVDFTIDHLRGNPDQGQWWMHYVLAGNSLVGSGGFTGPPQHGVAEIGCEIAPRHRGRGLATAAARALVAKALQTGEVTTVVAHTLAHPTPSTGVLTKLGFHCCGDVVDPEDGPLWRWELASEMRRT
jgi:ribosomal-protein-alanine N-acetyltransferase